MACIAGRNKTGRYAESAHRTEVGTGKPVSDEAGGYAYADHENEEQVAAQGEQPPKRLALGGAERRVERKENARQRAQKQCETRCPGSGEAAFQLLPPSRRLTVSSSSRVANGLVT